MPEILMKIPYVVRLLRRFEHILTLGYMLVLGGVFAGSAAAVAIIKPNIFVAMDLPKLAFPIACIGVPVVAFLGAALLISDTIGAPGEKLDVNKSAPGVLAASGYMAMTVEAISVVFSRGDVGHYVVALALATAGGMIALMGAGLAERGGKLRRKRGVTE